MSNLLFDERPLVLQPRLAFLLGGSDEAVILQQIHYWTQKNVNIRDGHSWVYNSMKEWHNLFYWISESKVKRIFNKLEKNGVLITGNYNKAKFDRTKWYRIDYDALDKMDQRTGQIDLTSESKRSNGKGQIDLTSESKRPNGKGQIDLTNTIDYTKTTTDINNTSETQIVSDDNKTETIKRKYTTDDQAYKYAVKLQEAILKNKPDCKRVNLQKWSNTFRLMHERDGRSWKDIGYVILYATADEFWSSNILSADKLRKQFDRLQLQMQRKNHKSKIGIVQKENLPGWAKGKGREEPKNLDPEERAKLDDDIDRLLAELEKN